MFKSCSIFVTAVCLALLVGLDARACNGVVGSAQFGFSVQQPFVVQQQPLIIQQQQPLVVAQPFAVGFGLSPFVGVRVGRFNQGVVGVRVGGRQRSVVRQRNVIRR